MLINRNPTRVHYNTCFEPEVLSSLDLSRACWNMMFVPSLVLASIALALPPKMSSEPVKPYAACPALPLIFSCIAVI